MNQMISLFLSQSYQDAWEDYSRSLRSQNFVQWDYVILTASNEQQAAGFKAQLADRQAAHFLPIKTKFAVISDPEGKRVGSGGATLNVIKYIAERENTSDFGNLRILVIHSGGDSKRVPQYSALGKLFSPVPHCLPNGRTSSLFDEFMIGMSGVPGRIKSGMLLLSGDVLLLLNSLQIDFSTGAACISFKEDVNTGKNHGVFLAGEDGNVASFLHKQTVETLKQCGAVNERNCVDIDTGAILFSQELVASLYSLISDESTKAVNVDKFNEFVNDKTRLSLYGDFLYPLASNSTLEDFYKEKPEGEYGPALTKARTAVWNAIRPYRLKLLRLSPAKFVHFGTTHEILELMTRGVKDYKYLGWGSSVNSSVPETVTSRNRISADKDFASLQTVPLSPITVTGNDDTKTYTPLVSTHVAAINSIIEEGANLGIRIYAEASYIHKGAKVGDNTVISYMDIYEEEIPDNVVVHGLKQKDGRFVVRIYGINDNPKDTLEDDGRFLGTTLKDFMARCGLETGDLWDTADHSIWNARLYAPKDTITEALKSSLKLCAMVKDGAAKDSSAMDSAGTKKESASGNTAGALQDIIKEFKASDRKSLCSGFNDADPDAIIAWDTRMQDLVKMGRLLEVIRRGGTVDEAKGLLEPTRALTSTQTEWVDSQLTASDFPGRVRLNYYIGCLIGGIEGDKYIARCFKTISEGLLGAHLDMLKLNENCKIMCDEHVVNLPLRVNFFGGWTDTPNICNEMGGSVLNAAISLDGKYPVQVTLRRLDEKKIIFDSRDMDIHGEFDSIEPLQATGDPYDPFALQKAALIACGIIPRSGSTLEEILDRLGGGFFMGTEVTNVPKGSGLGTSSILAGACVKALFEFMGIEYEEDDLYDHVLCMEQIMSTGGGWQDQVGGLTPGFKLIQSKPGLKQKLTVKHIDISDETLRELNERFVCIWSGQRRLARNLLRSVVGRYIGNEPDAIEALKKMPRVAALGVFELERGNVDAFAELMNEHWELSRMLDAGSTNTCIDQIFLSIEDLICGRMICGAGGGGFMQVILKKGVTREMLSMRLKEVFQDSGAAVWETSFV